MDTVGGLWSRLRLALGPTPAAAGDTAESAALARYERVAMDGSVAHRRDRAVAGRAQKGTGTCRNR